eukprot:5358986-Ditylum_brightwellii.AAC.1
MSHIMKLYPQQGVGGIPPDVIHKALDKNGSSFNYADDVLLCILKQLKTKKVAGPFANITDTLWDVTTAKQHFFNSKTNAQLAWGYLCLFACNLLPMEIQQAFSSVWLTLLHKEWPVNPNTPPKFQPIGSVSESQRAVATIIIKAKRNSLAAECIHQNNLGVGV